MEFIKNKFFIILISIVSITQYGCFNSVDPVFFADVERQFEIPAGLNTIETHFFILQDIPTFLDQNLELYGLPYDNVTSINPGAGRIESAFGNIDWTFVQTVEIYAVSNSDPNLKRQILYSREPDFINRSSIVMFNTYSDIKEIMSEPVIDLEVRLKFRQFVPANINARIVFEYGVYNEM